MAFVQITDPDKSWELLQAGLLWYQSYNGEFYPYTPQLIHSWSRARHYWGGEDGDTVPHDKYVLIEE